MTRGHVAHALVLLGATAAVIASASAPPVPASVPRRSAAPPPRSSAWLSRLPDGEAKRKFILDCTGCHQFDQKIARPEGTPRTEAQWAEAVTRMLGTPGRRRRSRSARPTGTRPAAVRPRDPPLRHLALADQGGPWRGIWPWIHGTARFGWRTERRRGSRPGSRR
jgi:hypothetical protein